MERKTESLFKTKDGKSVFLIPSNFKETNFERLLKEYTEKKYITWEIKGNGSTKMEKGDICYIKYTNLPSPDKDNNSRILLRGTIQEGATLMRKSEIYFHEKQSDTEKVKGFKIENLQPVKMDDHIKYSRKNLKNQYGLETNIQNIQQLNDNCAKLYEDIEKDINPKEELKDLIDYFNTPCFFEKYFHPNNPLTFKNRSNKIFYYENHHFIPQHKAKELNNYRFTEDIIDNPENYIAICALCHRRIHYGTQEDVSKMVEILYNEKKNFLEEKNISKYIGEDTDVLQWIKEAYKINAESNNSNDYIKNKR